MLRIPHSLPLLELFLLILLFLLNCFFAFLLLLLRFVFVVALEDRLGEVEQGLNYEHIL